MRFAAVANLEPVFRHREFSPGNPFILRQCSLPTLTRIKILQTRGCPGSTSVAMQVSGLDLFVIAISKKITRAGGRGAEEYKIERPANALTISAR